MPRFPRRLKNLPESIFLNNLKNNLWAGKRARFFVYAIKKQAMKLEK